MKNWTDADLRNLMIGVVGGLIVLCIAYGWRLARTVGVAGFLRFRRSVAKSELARLDRSGDRLLWLGRLVVHLLNYIGAIVIWAVFVAMAFQLASYINPPPSAQIVRLAQGFVTGILFGQTLRALRDGHLFHMAIEDHAALISELRRKAGLPQKSAPDLPAQNRP